MTPEEFQTTILKGTEAQNNRIASLETELKTVKSDRDKILTDFDRADKEVKKAMEELTKVKNECNDFALAMRKMEAVQKAVALNARSSFRDPIERALADEEFRVYLDTLPRYCAAKKSGDLDKIPAEKRKLIEEGSARMKALTGVDSSLGQATVPTEWFNIIYDTLLQYGQWSSLGVQRVGARTNKFPVATARPTYYWIGGGTGGSAEGTAITAGALTGDSVTLDIQTLAAYLIVSRELLQDSTVDMAPYVLRQLGQSVAYGLDFAAFTADGGADQVDAGYYGIFQIAQVNTQLAAPAAGGNTTIAGTQLEDWVRCLTTVSPDVLARMAKWWIHPTLLAKVILIRDGFGRPLFQTALEAPSSGSIGSILGYPVRPTGAAPSTDSASQPVAVFGDPDGQVVGIRQDLEVATSEDIKFAENQLAYRALMRAGVKARTLTGSTVLKPMAVLTLAAS